MNESVDSKTIFKRIISIMVILIVTIFSLYLFNSCSYVSLANTNMNEKIGINYYNDTMDYGFRIETKESATFMKVDQEKIFLEIEIRDGFIKCVSEDEKQYTFITLKNDRLLYKEKNIMFFNESEFVPVED